MHRDSTAPPDRVKTTCELGQGAARLPSATSRVSPVLVKASRSTRVLGRVGALALVGTSLLAACSTAVTSGAGGDGGSAEPAALVVSTTVAPTSAAPTTTLAPATTEATTTTAPTTIPPDTTVPPTTLPPSIVAVAPIDPPLVAVGSSGGGETSRIQLRLYELGFWLQGADGEYGLTTRQAVMAFEKYMGFEADGAVDQRTADALTAMTLRPYARANSGTLVEIDKSKQLLFFVVNGRTEWVLNVSTGNGQEYTEPDKNTPGETITGVSLTPSGLHKVNRERPEGWWEGDLGEIYRPKYFVGGVAVHGSNSIPNYPASHGCVRVSVPAMDWVWDSGIMPLNTPVWVHDGA
jgi:peptidoglycan hydrolase-like protein with peptidoglycan-binding domain